MANIIVVSFKKETKAIEALHKIKDLDEQGDITLYEFMLICKKENNKYVILNDETSKEVWRTFTGMALGALLPALAGPVGLVIGLYSGIIADTIWNNRRYDFEDDFVKKIDNKIKIGNTTLIAELGEDSSVFIDNALKPFNVEIVRSEADLEFDDYTEEQIDELEDKIKDQRKKLKHTTAGEKAKINMKITELKAKRITKIKALDTKRKSTLKKIKDTTKTKIEQLKSKLDNYEDTISNNIKQVRTRRLTRRIKKQEEKLYQLHNALGKDTVD